MKIVEKVLEKMSSYNIFNYIFPGIIFLISLEKIYDISFITKDIKQDLFLYYFVGLIISRVGSLVLEPLLQIKDFIKYAPYKDYITASKKDSKIDLLLEINNMYRTLCSLFFCLIIINLYIWLIEKFIFLKSYNKCFIVFGLFILFLLSFKKQTNFIKKRIEKNIEHLEGENE